MKFVYIFVCFLFLAFACPVLAAENSANVNVDLTQLSSQARNEILNKIEQEKSTLSKVVTPDNISALSNVAVEISTCIKDVAKNLNVEVNNFAQTPVGMMTLGLIVWNYFGASFILGAFGVINGLAVWGIITAVYFYIARRTFLPIKTKFIKFDKDGKKESIETILQFPYDEHNREAIETKNVWGFISSAVYVILTVIILIKIL